MGPIYRKKVLGAPVVSVVTVAPVDSNVFARNEKKETLTASFLSRWFGRVPPRTSRTYPSLDAFVSLVKNLSLKQDAFVDFGNSAFDKTLSPVRTLGAVVSIRFALDKGRTVSFDDVCATVGSVERRVFACEKRRRVEKVDLKSLGVSTAKFRRELARLTFPEPVFPAFFRKRLNLENAGSKNVG